MCCKKSRHGVLESNFSLWYSSSTDHRSNKIKIFYGQHLHFCKNCIGCASHWIPACVLVFLLAVMTPVLLACLFCSKEKIVVDCYTFKSMILQQQFWNKARELNYQASYTQCNYSQWQYQSDQKISSNKILNLLLQSTLYATIFWSITSTLPMLALYILIIFRRNKCVFVAEPLVHLIMFEAPSIPSIFVAICSKWHFMRTENPNLLLLFSCHL